MPDVKSLVVKVRADSMLVMSEEGEFRSFPLPENPPRVGEQLLLAWAPEEASRQARPIHPPLLKRQRAWVPLVAAAAAVMLLFSPAAYAGWSARQPAAVVAVDINPSLEITVDGREQVTGAEALNSDAAAVLGQLQLKGLPVAQAVAEVVDKATDLGYIREDQTATIVATVVPLRNAAKAPAPAALQNRIEAELTARDRSGYALGQAAGYGALQQARAMQLSLNQYLAMQKVQSGGAQITPDQVRGLKVREILALGGLTPELGFPGGVGVRRHALGAPGDTPGNTDTPGPGPGKGGKGRPDAGKGPGANGKGAPEASESQGQGSGAEQGGEEQGRSADDRGERWGGSAPGNGPGQQPTTATTSSDTSSTSITGETSGTVSPTDSTTTDTTSAPAPTDITSTKKTSPAGTIKTK